MEGENQEEDDGQDAPPPEEPAPPPEEPEPPPKELPPEEPPAEEPPPEEPPPEEPPPEEPLPEEPSPPPPAEEPPAEEPPPTTPKTPSLQPVDEEPPGVEESSVEEPTAVSAEDGDKPISKSANELETARAVSERSVTKKAFSRIVESVGGGGGGSPRTNPCGGFLNKRSPFIHNPPQPEERRARIANPRTPKEYIINLREDLADFQESHGLPRTRDYSFLSLGLALAQETARAIYSLVLMFTELFPIVAIISLIVRFALDKLIEILETTEPVPKLKKSVIFALQMLVIIIPLWILVGTIILPLISLVFSIFKRMFRLSGGKKRCSRAKTHRQCSYIGLFF